MVSVLPTKFGLYLRSVVRLSHSHFSCLVPSCYHSTRKEACKRVFRKPLTVENVSKFRCYSSSSEKSDDETKEAKVKAGLGKYKFFADFDSPVILDVEEERQLRLEKPELFEVDEEKEDEFSGINLESKILDVTHYYSCMCVIICYIVVTL